jgi:pimeloyl-ACP methyl ester carboxylesterase
MTGLSHLQQDGRRLAYRLRAGRGPALVFLPGYASDMEGGKASALDSWAEAQGRSMLRFDYGGCGASDGEFEDQTLETWRDDALAMIDHVAPPGPLVLIGSSMGGWLMLLAALARPERVAALVGIAAAPDFTSWGYSDAQKAELLAKGRIEEPNPHGDAPTITTLAFWDSGASQLLLGKEIAIDCPVRLLQGQCDPEVHWTVALDIAHFLRSSDVQTILVKDGDHRLSREDDLALLIATVSSLLESL